MPPTKSPQGQQEMLCQKVRFSRLIVLCILSLNLSVLRFGAPIAVWKGAMLYETFVMPSRSTTGSDGAMTRR